MKIIVLLTMVVAIGFILAAGCVAQTKKEPVNATVNPTNTFTPFSNVTNTSNMSNITVSSGLKGPLRVSIGGWDAALPVSIDNKSAGIVSKDKPLDLMLEEGNHTVKVCAGSKCEEENVIIQFARPHFVDFEERLINDVGFPKPTARIIGYNPAGSQILVNVEFINPSSEDLLMSAFIRCGYTYIDDRSESRVGSVAEGILTADVPSGKRVTDTMELSLASGYSYTYTIPVISQITTN
jgi:hypothetical protein